MTDVSNLIRKMGDDEGKPYDKLLESIKESTKAVGVFIMIADGNEGSNAIVSGPPEMRAALAMGMIQIGQKIIDEMVADGSVEIKIMSGESGTPEQPN